MQREMATPPGPGLAQQQAGAKGDLAPVLQQLNMNALRTRTQDLHSAIGRILHSFRTSPSSKWSEVLAQFAMVNVELLTLVDDIKPILRQYVVYPKNVNAENAPILPIMLSSKLLPEIEAEEAAMKEQILAGIANLPVPVQTEKLQRQTDAVRAACEIAEKVITEARKVYGLGTRQGPVALPTLDKLHATRIAEQEKLLRVATNYGEGLRIPTDQQQPPPILPQHLSAAFATTGDGRTSSYPGADGGFLKTSIPVLPPTGLRTGAQQQAAATPQLTARVQTPTQSAGVVGVGGLAGASPSQVPYIVNSPRSGGPNFNVPSPQQSQQMQQQSQAALMQRAKVQQQQQQHQQHQQQHLQRQQQMAQLQQQHHQQQQQLRRPATPPIPQAHVGGQPQAQVAQPLLQQQNKQLQQLQQQQNQNRLSQQYQQQAQLLQQQQQQAQQLQQERQAMHHMQVSQQQQNLQHQMQTTQNTVQQVNQVRPQMGQLTNLYGSGTQNLLTSNMMGAMSQPMQSQLQHRIQQFQQGNQPQQNVPAMLSDSMYNMGVTGAGTQLTQNSPNLGLPLQQQQQLPPTNYTNMFNNSMQSNFAQNRQQPPPSQ